MSRVSNMFKLILYFSGGIQRQYMYRVDPGGYRIYRSGLKKVDQWYYILEFDSCGSNICQNKTVVVNDTVWQSLAVMVSDLCQILTRLVQQKLCVRVRQWWSTTHMSGLNNSGQ